MNVRTQNPLQFFIAMLDLALLNLVYFITFFLFKKNGLVEEQPQYSYFNYLLNASWLISVISINIYNRQIVFSFEKFTKRTAKAYAVFLLIISLALFFSRMMFLSRIFITVVLAVIPFAFLFNRFLFMGINLYLKKGQNFISKIIIIGYNNFSKKVTGLLEQDGVNKQIIGYCEEFENVNELSNYPILSNIENTLAACKKYGATEIYSTIAPEQNTVLYKLINQAEKNCIRFKIVPDLGVFTKNQMHLDQLSGMPVISMRKEPLEDISNRIKKRVFDVVISSVVIIFILSWLMPLVALLTWIDSRGSVFFMQKRTGRGNKDFNCIKFRSMQNNTDAHSRQASRHDERITKFGSFLRRNNIDEFPQFINVLKGEMSIVGPRPHMLKHTDEYSTQIDNYMVRQFLKPGITGWAQVNGLRGETQIMQQMQDRVEHDIWYLENWSLMLDLKIFFMTIINTLSGDKNAF